MLFNWHTAESVVTLINALKADGKINNHGHAYGSAIVEPDFAEMVWPTNERSVGNLIFCIINTTLFCLETAE